MLHERRVKSIKRGMQFRKMPASSRAFSQRYPRQPANLAALSSAPSDGDGYSASSAPFPRASGRAVRGRPPFRRGRSWRRDRGSLWPDGAIGRRVLAKPLPCGTDPPCPENRGSIANVPTSRGARETAGNSRFSARCYGNGVPDRTRTCDPRFRKPMLYPAELRGHRLRNSFARNRVVQTRTPPHRLTPMTGKGPAQSRPL